MFKILAVFLVVYSLGASEKLDKCEQALNYVTEYHYMANEEKNPALAVKYYHLSTDFAYIALEECKEDPLYNHKPLYNYIISNRDKIQKIYDSKAL